MNYGLYLAASGAMTSMYRLDVLANNLANVNTVAFKHDYAVTRQRDVARVEDRLPSLPSNKLLERLGAGVHMAPTRTIHQQGPMQQTGGPLDAAIQGDGYFVLQDSRAGPNAARLTRDGRFALADGCRLISAASGLPVLDADGSPIILPSEAPPQIDTDGTIRQRGAVVARLQFVSVRDTTRFNKAGHGQFVTAADNIGDPARGQVRQGYVEGSSVDPVDVLVEITRAQRAAEAGLSLMTSHDRLVDRAVNQLGRVS
jgi:flagellar basal body rod protein FlgG